MNTKDNNSTGPRDVFLHLLETIALYICVGTFMALLFSYINIFFPDVLQYQYGDQTRSLLWPMATLIVVFPFYVWLTGYLQKDVKAHPGKRKLKTRRWLLHLTAFLAVIIIASDLIALIYNFLSGGLTTPFILKVIVVFLISAITLVYYGWILRKDILPREDTRMRVFVRTVVVLGAVAVLGGFFVAGSPFEQRSRELDMRRVSDLQNIQWQVVDHWQNTGTLPEDLNTLRDEIRGFVPPTDPETDEPYEYNVVGELSFELCATFSRSNTGESSRTPYAPSRFEPTAPLAEESVWEHEAGRTCFERSIDPERYPVRE